MTEPTSHPSHADTPAADDAVSTPPTLAETGPTELGAPISMADEFLSRARTARDQHNGHPPESWSTGEQSAVALLLGSTDTLQRLDMTAQQAVTRLADDLGTSPRQAAEWAIQARQTL